MRDFIAGLLRGRAPVECRDLYLDLIKKCLSNLVYGDDNVLHGSRSAFNERTRTEGRDWPAIAHTMIGLRRLDNLQFCVQDVLARRIPGDLMETGVWRGGATIFMRAILKAHGVNNRKVWAADSFQGVPPPDVAKYPLDAHITFHQYLELAVPLQEVQENFRRYGLLDDQVGFLKGLFKDTLPAVPIERLAVLRLDGDLYESTMDALVNLYPKLQRGGYLIIDDYNDIPACRRAVLDYREQHRITEDAIPIDWSGVYWMKRN